VYTSPTEVVHGFDVDCCGIVWDPNYPNEDGTKGALFCTKRAHYSITHRENWIDPSRVSPSYAYRLSKYQARDIDIKMPLFDESMIVKKQIKKWRNNIRRHFQYKDHDYDADGFTIGDSIVLRNPITMLEKMLENVRKNPLAYTTSNDFMREMKSAINMDKQEYGSMFRYIVGTNRDIARSILPTDPVSILILAAYERFHTPLWSVSDYQPKACKEIKVGYLADLVSHI
jgi:hypothetical protein